MILDISIAIASAAFVVLVVYLAVTLTALYKTLKSLNATLLKINLLVEPVSEETTKLLKTSNHIADFAREKTEDLESIFSSISNIGECVDQATETLKENLVPKSKPLFVETVEENTTQKVVSVLEWAAMGLILWQKINKRSQQ